MESVVPCPARSSTPFRVSTERKSLEKTRTAGVGVRASRSTKDGGPPIVIIETRWRSENEQAGPPLCPSFVSNLSQNSIKNSFPALSATTHPHPPKRTTPPPFFFPALPFPLEWSPYQNVRYFPDPYIYKYVSECA